MTEYITSALPQPLEPSPANLQKIMADWDFNVDSSESTRLQLFVRIVACAKKTLEEHAPNLSKPSITDSLPDWYSRLYSVMVKPVRTGLARTLSRLGFT